VLPPRFFVPYAGFAPGNEVELPTDEARHASCVLRLVPGEQAMVFDGRGNWAVGPVVRAEKDRVTIRATETGRDPVPDQDFTLACAWPQSAAVVDEIVARATELGVDRLVFWRAERSQRAPALSPRIERVAVAACKQCGRNHFPGFETAGGLDDVLGRDASRTWFAAVEPGVLFPPGAWARATGNCGVLIGPEGGYTAREITLLGQAGARPVSLGPWTLRVEVAATVASFLILNGMGRLGTRMDGPRGDDA